MLSKENHLCRFGIGDDNVDEAIAVEISGGNVSFPIGAGASEAILNQACGQFVRFWFGPF